MFKKIKELFQLDKSLQEKSEQLKRLDNELEDKEKIKRDTIEEAKKSFEKEYEELSKRNVELLSKVQTVEAELEKKEKEVIKQEKIAKKYKTECVGIKQLTEKFPEAVNFPKIEEELSQLEVALGEGVLSTLVELDLHFKDSKALRKEMTATNSEIKKLLKSYEGRYTTKANKTIYHLMVIGLQAELQNILYTLKYTNLDKAIENAKNLIEKYLIICGEGNASILPTITRFLSELEPLFQNAIQIEYKHYIQKEKEKEEQRLIREQMKQEAEERRLLEKEREKLEQEEAKYKAEIEKNQLLLASETDEGKIAALKARLEELTGQISELEEKKEEIVKRSHGKAGYVYVISNLGSFGEQMFKVGMTRRLNPLDRIDELGNASVPFKFDIHAMVFSDDAVGLEQKLHERLEQHRVNKVNLRKEFFYSDVVKLQELVEEIDSTVEFTTTLIAAEYRQSQSIEKELIKV